MSDEAHTRREMLTVKAFDPTTGDEIDVYISHQRLRAVGSRSMGQTKEAATILPQVLQFRGPVFEGLTTDADEDSRGVGWRCYCGRPDKSFTQDGEERPPRRGQVYLVFVNEARVVYNWRWEKSDPDNPDLPIGYDTRFKRRLT